jgi:predicted MFS family arabinose efflux permease
VQTRRIHLATLLASLFVLVIVLVFNAWLTMTALKKNYVTSLVGSYTVAGGECRRKIEYAVRYGKPLENFYGMKELLQEVKQDAVDLADVRVVLPNGKILYDLKGKTERALSGKMLRELDLRPGLNANIVIRQEGSYALFLPIQDRQNNCIGLLNLVFDESLVDARVDVFWRQNIRDMLKVALVSAALLGALLFTVPIISPTGAIRNKLIFTILLSVLGVAQLYYGLTNITMFKNIYLEIVQKNTQLSGRIIQKDINQITHKGVSYAEMAGVEAWFDSIMRLMKETGSISIHDAKGRTLHRSLSPDASNADPAPSPDYTYRLPLDKSLNNEEGMLQIVLSKTYIDGKIRDLQLDVLTILVTSFFFAVELIIFLLFLLTVQTQKTGLHDLSAEGNLSIRIIRPLTFLFFIAFDMSISFIPLYMKKLYEPLLGLPKDIILGLPISAEMICIALSSYLAGLLVDKKGWRLPFFLGLAVVATGVLLSALTQNALLFIIARAIIGVGYGLTLVSMEGYLLSGQSKDSRLAGFSQLYAGLYAGKLCAAALGAMLAERLGYSTVFFIQIAMLSVPLLFALCFAKDHSPHPAKAAPVINTDLGALRRFLSNRQILTFFLLITLPSMVCTVGFLCYFFPLFSNSLGVSTSNTGRAFMIYGVCFILLGPALGRFIAKRGNAMKYVYLAGSTGVIAMFVFFWQGSFVAALIAIFLLGLSDTINSVAQTGYFLNLDATHALGEGKGLGLLRLTRKIGEALGPIVFGGVLMLGTRTGIGLVGATYFLLIVLFFVTTWMNSSKRGAI